MDTSTIELVKVIGDVIVKLAGMYLASYAFRLCSDYLHWRRDTTGKPLFQSRLTPEEAAIDASRA